MEKTLQMYLDSSCIRVEQMLMTTLRCDNKNITSLKGIEKLTKLEILSISNNELKTLDGIENLENLIFLDCSSTKISCLKPLKKLKKLSTVTSFNLHN